MSGEGGAYLVRGADGFAACALKALVAFELKVGAFAPEYAGKMDF